VAGSITSRLTKRQFANVNTREDGSMLIAVSKYNNKGIPNTLFL